MSRAYRGTLNPSAVRAADDAFYAEHPDMVRDGNRMPIGIDGDDSLQEEWWSHYKHAISSTAAGPQLSNTAKVGSPVQSCPFKRVDLCELRSIEVGCGHTERSHRVRLPGAAGKVPPFHELHVIAGPEKKPDKVTINMVLSKPLCDAHRQASIECSAPLLFQQTSPTGGELTATCDRWDVSEEPFKYVWLDEIAPRVLTLTPTVCAIASKGPNPAAVVVKVYPDIKWGWSVTLDLPSLNKPSHDEPTSEKMSWTKDYSEAQHTTTVGQWGVKGKVACRYDGIDYEFKRRFNRYTEREQTLNGFHGVFDNTLPRFRGLFGETIEFEGPSVSIGYNAELAERGDGYGVQKKYDWTFGVEFGASHKADVTEWVLDKLGRSPNPVAIVVARSLLAAKRALKKERKIGAAKMQADAAIEASLAGKLSANFIGNGLGEKHDASGQMRGEVTIQLEGRLEGEVSYLELKAKGVLKAGGTASVCGTLKVAADQIGPYFTGAVRFNGLVLYYAASCDIGAEVKELKRRDAQQVSDVGQESERAKKFEPLIDPYPKDEEDVLLDRSQRRYLWRNQ